jgi:TP901-1 family phage major tail protein
MAILGSNLALYYRGPGATYVPFAAATSCNLTSNTAQIEVTNYNTDWFRDYKMDMLDWSVTTDGLITIDDVDYKDLLDFQLNRTRIVVRFSAIGLKQDVFFGRAYITDITLSAPVEGVATYSVTVTGAGPFRFTDPTLCLRFKITLNDGGVVEWQDCDTGDIKSIGFTHAVTFYQCATVFGGLPQIEIIEGTGTIESTGYCSQ